MPLLKRKVEHRHTVASDQPTIGGVTVREDERYHH
jgi:hypothetical protein